MQVVRPTECGCLRLSDEVWLLRGRKSWASASRQVFLTQQLAPLKTRGMRGTNCWVSATTLKMNYLGNFVLVLVLTSSSFSSSPPLQSRPHLHLVLFNRAPQCSLGCAIRRGLVHLRNTKKTDPNPTPANPTVNPRWRCSSSPTARRRTRLSGRGVVRRTV